jgi:hypothetical protein
VIREAKWLAEHQTDYISKPLQSIKGQLPELEKLLAEAEDPWSLEDDRFYRQSFKVYNLQKFGRRKAVKVFLPLFAGSATQHLVLRDRWPRDRRGI